jgi:uncharacterized protein (DUF1330 family)
MAARPAGDQFPSRTAAEDWYESEAYQKIISLRLKSTGWTDLSGSRNA